MELSESTKNKLNLITQNFIISKDIYTILEPLTLEDVNEYDVHIVVADLLGTGGEAENYIASTITSILSQNK